MSDVTKMSDVELAAELESDSLRVHRTIRTGELLHEAARRLREYAAKLAEVERERDAAARELASLPITIRVAGHGPVMARVTTFDNARMLFAGLQATSENGGNFGWVIEDTRPPIIPAIAPQPAEKEESR